MGASLTSTALIYSQLWAGARLSMALVALVAAFVARPPRALVWAVAIGLVAGLCGMWFAGAVSTVTWVELKPFWKWCAIDGLVALLLIATGLLRARLRRRIA